MRYPRAAVTLPPSPHVILPLFLAHADSAATAAALAQFVPSCVEDFSRKWLLYVMQQYYAKSYGTTISEIGEFSAQRLCTSNKNKGTKRDRRALENHSGEGNDEDMEGREVTTPESQHILSQAYKVMVDVPDPPKEELADDAGKKVSSGRTKTVALCKMHPVKANSNIQGTKNVARDY